MGTDLRDVPNIARSISMKRNWGGNLYGGETIVVTTSNPEYEFNRERSVIGMFHQIRVNRDEARHLAQELMLFAEGNEVEHYDDEADDENVPVKVISLDPAYELDLTDIPPVEDEND